ncbi:MAG: hypothetical protein KC609_12000 [Myxococcales bacterium]|nr:hypothetical protein [Myxococcales bacterium]
MDWARIGTLVVVIAVVWALGACSGFSSSAKDATATDTVGDSSPDDVGLLDSSTSSDADRTAASDLDNTEDLSAANDLADGSFPDVDASAVGDSDAAPPPDGEADALADSTIPTSSVKTLQDPGHHECDVTLGQPQFVELVRLAGVVVTSPLFTLGADLVGFYVADPDGGDYSGILIVGTPAQVGDPSKLPVGATIELDGSLQELYCNTQITLTTALVVIGSTAPPAAAVVDCQTLTSDGERYEGRLVQLGDVVVLQVSLPNGDVLIEDANGDSCELNGAFFSLAPFAVGQRFVAIRGMVQYRFGVFHTQPRALTDLESAPCGLDAGVCFDAGDPDADTVDSNDGADGEDPDLGADLLDAAGTDLDDAGPDLVLDASIDDVVDDVSDDLGGADGLDAELDGSPDSADITIDVASPSLCGNGVKDGHESATDCGGVRIFVNRFNEISGDDAPTKEHLVQLVLAGPENLALSGWSLVFYGVTTGARLHTMPLSSGALDQQPTNGFSLSTSLNATFSWQDDPNHAGSKLYQHLAVAVVSPRGQVLDFVGLASSVTPFDGPAIGLTSVALGLPNGWTAGSGEMFYRSGTGSHPTDFSWTFGAVTPDAANPNQLFTPSCAPCQLAQSCQSDLDCAGSVCTNGSCSLCGNGVRDGVEECDDGNVSNTDFCTNSCKNSCPYGDKKLVTGGSCVMYFRAVTKVNWSAANARCQALGAHLLRITSQQENDAVVSLMSEFDFAWLGLNDLDSEGNPVWALDDGQSDPNVPYGIFNAPWANTDEADCGMIFGGTSNGAAKGRWGYTNCATQLYWFCERELPQ